MSRLLLLPEVFSVCRLESTSPVPSWAEGGWTSVTRTAEELSVVCESIRVPDGVRREAGWRIFRVEGTLDFSLVGILSSLLAPLAAARVPMFALSTFDTDYLLVKEETLEAACRAFTDSGHFVRR